MAEPGHKEAGKDRSWRRPLRSFAMRVKNDDLLTGFSREASTAPETRSFFVRETVD